MELESIQLDIMHRGTDLLSFDLDALQTKCIVLLYTHKWSRAPALHRDDNSAFLQTSAHTTKCQDNSNEIFAIFLRKAPWYPRKGFNKDLQHSKGNLLVPL